MVGYLCVDVLPRETDETNQTAAPRGSLGYLV
jgi:hypothetical protein